MKILNTLASLLIFIGLLGCEKTPTDEIRNNKFEGKVEKGPFIEGSVITIQELDANLALTGKSFQTTVKNDDGSFYVETTEAFASPYVMLACEGYYFNEVTGALSNSIIHLDGIVDLTNTSTCNVNILTHLIKDRVNHLVKSGLSFKDAQHQAESELLRCFNLQQYEDLNLNNLSIADGSHGAGVLTVISSILLNGRSDAEFTEHITRLANSLTNTGSILSSLKEEINENAKQLNLAQISNNIKLRYESMGKSVKLIDLKHFIDWDNDGVAGNELGDPNVEEVLEFNQDTLFVGSNGGEYRIEISSNIKFTDETDAPIDVIPSESILDNINYSYQLEDDAILIHVSQASGVFMENKTISLYSYNKAIKADLVIIQQGDFSNERSSEIVKALLSDLTFAFDYTYTIEAFYSNSYTTNSPGWGNFYRHNINPDTDEIYHAWGGLFKANNSLNTIQSLLQNAEYDPHFISLSALIYMQLVTLWGDVPYVDKQLSMQDMYVSRTEVSVIYNKLKEELEKAAGSLPTEASRSLLNPSKDVPNAIRAMILLEEKKYDECLFLLEDITRSSRYLMNSNLSDVLSGESRELVYSIKKDAASMPIFSKEINTEEHLPLVLYSDLILMMAECEYMTGKEDLALEHINALAARNGLSQVSTLRSISDFKAVWLSTMKGGFSYFKFLKRNNLANTELNIEDYKLQLPIPLLELLVNPKLTQNAGY